MRGFVLRFDIASVPPPEKPVRAGHYGKSFYQPPPVGADIDQTYGEQDIEGSKNIELKQCRERCGEPCQNHLLYAVKGGEAVPLRTQSSLPALSSRTTSHVGFQEVSIDENRPGGEKLGTTQKHSDSVIHLTDFGKRHDVQSSHSPSIETSPSTLVGSPSALAGSPNVLMSSSHNRLAVHSLSRDATLVNEPAVPAEAIPKIAKNKKHGLGYHKVWKGTWALNSSQMFYAYKSKIILDLPQVTSEELKDRSKGDGLVKGFAILQIAWLVIQIIARSFQNLAITQLEVTVLAFAATAIVTYLSFLHKPQDIKQPIYVDVPNILTREQVIGLAARSPVSTLFVHEFFLYGVAIRGMADNIFPSSPGFPIKLLWKKEKLFLNPVLVGIGVGGAIFGSVHFAAWNFDFPTSVERLLWRISCIVLAVLPAYATAIYVMTSPIAKMTATTGATRFLKRIQKPFDYAFAPLYLFARFFLIVEVFRSLANLPESAFEQVNWPSIIPHVN